MTAPLRNRDRDAVFLCYHSVAEDGPPFVSIGPDAFERQLALLRRREFRSGTLDDLADLARGSRPDAKLVFLTIDDGYRDTFTIARPLLDAYGFRAIVFVIPPFLDGGAPLSWPRVERHVQSHPDVMRSMDWEMAATLADEGHAIGSHTLGHPVLPELDDERLAHELAESRAQLVDRLGGCDAIGYPFGLWTRRVADAAAAAGYSYGFTLPYGAQRDADALTVPRISVDHRDDERRFRQKLSPLYRRLMLSPIKPAARRLLGRSPAHQTAASGPGGAGP
jgi:peptidoglycan/xylan/chitin deacetylase (PgdA/CDA1 family)